MTDAVIVALVGIAVNALLVLGGGAWKLSRVEIAIRAAVARHRQEIDEEISKLQVSIVSEGASLRREFGEVAAAIRQKINEVELFSRDTFLRRASFYEALRATNEVIEKMGTRLEIRFEKLSEEVNQRRSPNK